MSEQETEFFTLEELGEAAYLAHHRKMASARHRHVVAKDFDDLNAKERGAWMCAAKVLCGMLRPCPPPREPHANPRPALEAK